MVDLRIGLAASALLLFTSVPSDAQRRGEARRPRPTPALTPIDLGFSSDAVAAGGPLVAFERSEAQAVEDLNGDGDQLDLVVAVWNAENGQLLNTGLERSGAELFVPMVDSGRVFVFTDEALDQIDHDGDGDQDDVLLGVFDVAANEGAHVETLVDRFPFASIGVIVDTAGDVVAVETPEALEPPRDWNGDGDSVDVVIRLLHLGDSNRLSPPSPLIPRTSAGPLLATACCGEELAGASWFELTPDFLFVAVNEAHQGGIDIDGNGIFTDTIVHAVNVRTDHARSLGINSTTFRSAGGFLGVVGRESLQTAGVDLNGDGDTTDLVFFQVDMETGAQAVVPLAISPFAADGYVPYGERALLWVREADQGATDLNGDGDTADAVLHVRDLNALTTTNTGLVPRAVGAAGDALVFGLPEDAQGNTDLNGDGDATDWVLYRYQLSTGTVTNLVTAVVKNVIPPSSERLVAIYVSEPDQSGFDFNFDTDGTDRVLAFYDGQSNTFKNAALALDTLQMRVAGRFAAFLVSEADQGGTDLNGDLDTNDAVLHLYDADLGTAENLGLEADSIVLSEEVLAFTAGGTLHVLPLD